MVLQARISSTSTSSSSIPKLFDTRLPDMQSAHKMKKAGSVCQGLPPEMASTVMLRNLTVPKLYEMALLHDAGTKTVANGALAAYSGKYTGRCPADKRVVKNAESEANIWWGGSSPNIALSDASFLQNRSLALDFLCKQERVYVQDGFVNWGPQARTKVRVVCSRAYHALFMRNMMIRPTPEELDDFGEPDFTIFNAGACPANPDVDGVSSNVSVAVNLERREMVILGTEYAGEMKKGIFTIMHYLMPLRGTVSLHSGSNIGQDGDVTLFFGLSGTGKTTLSADSRRPLIGDDEHCWGDDGVFNIEGGCYAKCINLSQEQEPHIWNAIRFGAVLENVKVDEFDEVDYDDVSITENTRACYPVEHIEHAHIPCVASHPKNIIMLCCDAFGVLPPVARLTSAQAMYHFISGYTAKVAGTEMGITEPQATFSACFGGAFLMWHPMKYAAMLAEKMEKHGTHCWLLNTGWTGGSYGVGSRIKLRYTRAIVDAIHSGELSKAPYSKMPIFNLHIPTLVSGVPAEVLQPRCAWANPTEYDEALTQLAQLFNKNMQSFKDGRGYVSDEVAAEILQAGPALPAAPSPPTPTVPIGSCVIAHKVASQTKLSEVDLHGSSPPIGVWTAHGDRVKC